MASKISGQTMYLPIVPYKVDDSPGEEFNELSVTVNFDSHRKHFYVAIHAGWKSSWGGHGCIIMGDDDPLTAPKYVAVKDSPKNSQKTINEMFDNLQAAKCDIAWLFDQRDWTRLYAAVRNIALNGYVDQYREQMKALIEETNNNQNSSTNNKEDKTMKLNLSNNNNETKNAAKQQVTNNASEPIVKQVDVMGLMGALSRDGHAKLSDHVIEDAEAVEVKDEQAEEIESVSVREVTLATIMPKMTAEPEPEKPVENTGEAKIVVAGVPKPTEKPKPQMPKRDKNGKFLKKGASEPAETAAAEAKPSATKKSEVADVLPKVHLATYVTKRTQETAPRIIGFSGEDDPRWKPIYDEKQALVAEYNKAKKKDPKAKMTSSPFGPAWLSDREGNGEKQYCMTFGVRYMDVARKLCEAYNTNDRDQWHKAEQAVRDLKAGIVSGYQAEKAARRAEREAKKAAAKANTDGTDKTDKPAAPAATGYSKEDVAAMLRDVLAGKDLPKEVAELMAA